MEQLVYRRHEVYRAYAAFSQFVKGRSGDAENAFKLLPINDGDGEVDSFTWLEAVNCDEKVALVAHSFGGATLVCLKSL